MSLFISYVDIFPFKKFRTVPYFFIFSSKTIWMISIRRDLFKKLILIIKWKYNLGSSYGNTLSISFNITFMAIWLMRFMLRISSKPQQSLGSLKRHHSSLLPKSSLLLLPTTLCNLPNSYLLHVAGGCVCLWLSLSVASMEINGHLNTYKFPVLNWMLLILPNVCRLLLDILISLWISPFFLKVASHRHSLRSHYSDRELVSMCLLKIFNLINLYFLWLQWPVTKNYNKSPPNIIQSVCEMIEITVLLICFLIQLFWPFKQTTWATDLPLC